MILILLVYLLFASTFTLGKAVLSYIDPILFIAVRMSIGGALLLGYLAYWRPAKLGLQVKDWALFAQVALFHIYCAYVFEFWALQYITSAKTCLLYNISPFFTALYSYFFFNEKLTSKKWLGLMIGFSGMILILITSTPLEQLVGHISIISFPELVLLVAIASGAYGWILMRKLVHRGYSPLFVNGSGMFAGGCMAFITSLVIEGWPTLKIPAHQRLVETFLSQFFSLYMANALVCMLYTGLLILIGNVIVYNLYGYLIRTYSLTFLSFAGFTTPIFAALLGWFFLGELISWQFFASTALTFFGLYMFYQEE